MSTTPTLSPTENRARAILSTIVYCKQEIASGIMSEVHNAKAKIYIEMKYIELGQLVPQLLEELEAAKKGSS